MILQVYSVYDAKAEAFMTPFYMQAKGQAIRAFTDTVNDDSHAFSKHPQDYTLFEIGSWDDSNGSLISLDTPVSLGLGIEFKDSK